MATKLKKACFSCVSNCCRGICGSHICKIVGVILTVISIILSSVTVVKKISYDVSAKDELLEVSRLFASSMPHPTVTLCSSNQLRKSYVALLVANDVIDVLTNFPTSWDQFVDKLTTLDELDTTKFFLNAAQLKENLIIGCKFPDGSTCSHANFETKMTDAGICVALQLALPGKAPISESIPTYDSPLEITANLESYDQLTPSEELTNLKVSFLQSNGEALISESTLEISPGSLAKIALTYVKIKKNPESCECKKNSRPKNICKAEFKSQTVKKNCGCSSYNDHGRSADSSICKVSQHLTCVPKHSSDISIVKKSNKIFSNSFLLGASERSNDASNCDNNCEIELFESDLSLSPLTTAQLDSKIDLGSLVNYFDYISQPSTASDLQVKCKAFLSAYDRMISFFEPNLTTPSTYLNDRNISQFTLPDAIDFTSVIILKLSFVETLLSEGLTNFTNVTYLDIISTEMATNLNSIGQFCNSTHWFNNSLCSVGNIFDTINCMESERSDNSTIAEACKVKIEQLLRQKPSEIWQAYAIELSIFPNILKNLLGDIYKIDSILSTGLLSKNQTAILGALCSDFLVGKNAIGLTNFLSNEYTEFVVVSQVYNTHVRMQLSKLIVKLMKYQAILETPQLTNFLSEDYLDFFLSTAVHSHNFTREFELANSNLQASLEDFSPSVFQLKNKAYYECCKARRTEKLVRNNLVKLVIYFKEEERKSSSYSCCTKENVKQKGETAKKQRKADISYSAAQLLVVIVVSVTVLTQFCQCYRQNDIIHKLTNILHEIVTVGKAVELLGDSVKQKLNEIADRISEMVKDKLTKKTDEPNLVVMDIEEIFDKKMLVEEHVV